MKENRYYVYLHKIASTGEVFYVGKGQRSRLTSVHGRNISWHNITKDNEWLAEKYKDNLSEDEAATLEVKLIAELNPLANIHKKDIRPKPIKQEYFEKFFYYCPTSKTGLRFKQDGKTASCKGWRKAGDEAGGLMKSGYYSVRVDGQNYMVHRIVWSLNHGDLDHTLVDHKDKNRSNNRIENLRLVTHSINGKNSSIKRHNKTGHIGISFVKKFNIYTATWSTDDGEPQTKHFSATKHGNDLALALAVEYRHRKTLEISTYTPNENYLRLPALNNLSEEDITKMFECDLVSTNTSGINGIYFHSVKGNGFWVYRKGRRGVKKSFSCTKYGNEQAKKLAIEYKDYIENSLDFSYLSSGLKEEITNYNNANNSSGIRGIIFTGVNKDIVTAQCSKQYKGLSVRFDTKIYGLLPAIKMALEWRERVKKE